MNGYEKRTLEKKNQVLKATFSLINSDTGVENVTIDDIAEYAKVGKTSIFKYFGTKDNLIHDVYYSFLYDMANSAREVMSRNMSFEETMTLLTQNKINLMKSIHKRFYLDLMEYVTEKNDSGISRMMEQYIKESIGIMLDLFHRGRKEGKVDLKYSDEFLLLYFETIVEGMSNPKIYEKMLPYTQEWTEMIIKGIAPSK